MQNKQVVANTSTPAGPQVQEPIKVLLIDDEKSFCIGTSELLKSYGYQADFATDVTEGIILIDSKKPDIILLDVNLNADLNGPEVLEIIRKQHKSTPVIMLTSMDALDMGVNCMKRGAYDYMTKPFNEEKFFQLAEGAMEKRKAMQLSELYYHIIVHDLKNPLNTLITGLDILRDEGTIEQMSEENQQLVSQMRYSVKQLISMVNNILTLDKFENNCMFALCDDFKLKDSVESETNAFSDGVLKKTKNFNVVYNTKPDYVMRSNRELFFQVMWNLIANANRHTPTNGSITIEFNEKPDHQLEVSITNTGSFIKENLREKIFDKYFQVHHYKEAITQNFGLGLTYCKFAVGLMNGKIWVESDEATRVTTFKFTIKNQI